jgi:hypothetical protein
MVIFRPPGYTDDHRTLRDCKLETAVAVEVPAPESVIDVLMGIRVPALSETVKYAAPCGHQLRARGVADDDGHDSTALGIGACRKKRCHSQKEEKLHGGQISRQTKEPGDKPPAFVRSDAGH